MSKAAAELSKAKLEKAKRLGEKAQRYWTEVYHGTHRFDRQVRASALFTCAIAVPEIDSSYDHDWAGCCTLDCATSGGIWPTPFNAYSGAAELCNRPRVAHFAGRGGGGDQDADVAGPGRVC